MKYTVEDRFMLTAHAPFFPAAHRVDSVQAPQVLRNLESNSKRQ